MFSDFKNPTLRKKYPYSELFWSAFSRIFPHTGNGKSADQKLATSQTFFKDDKHILFALILVALLVAIPADS